MFLDEVAGDSERQEGNEEHGRHVGDDPQGAQTQQGGAGEALQGGGDVLVDGVRVRGKPVEDAAEGSRLKQPEGAKGKQTVHFIDFRENEDKNKQHGTTNNDSVVVYFI